MTLSAIAEPAAAMRVVGRGTCALDERAAMRTPLFCDNQHSIITKPVA